MRQQINLIGLIFGEYLHKLVHKFVHKLVHKFVHKLVHKFVHKLVHKLYIMKNIIYNKENLKELPIN